MTKEKVMQAKYKLKIQKNNNFDERKNTENTIHFFKIIIIIIIKYFFSY